MDNKSKYREILEELIKKSFPRLREKNIKIKVKKIKKGSMRADGYITKNFRVTIDPFKYNNATEKQIRGALAHELVHFDDYLDMDFIDSLLFFVKYHFNEKFTEKYEKETDRKIIQKGFARELFANRKFRLGKFSIQTKKDKKILKNYLLHEDIKSYAEKIGKW